MLSNITASSIKFQLEDTQSISFHFILIIIKKKYIDLSVAKIVNVFDIIIIYFIIHSNIVLLKLITANVSMVVNVWQWAMFFFVPV